MADALLGGIIINEILADPNSSTANFDTDGNGVARGADEFVEFYNSSSSAIDISGLELWDAGRGNWFTFPAGTVLQPGAHAMVITRVQNNGSLPTGGPDDLFFDAAHTAGNVINNGRDNVVLYDPTNDEYIQALYNNDTLDDPPTQYTGFSATATRVGAGEDFGNDIDGYSIQRSPDGSDSFVNNQTPTPGTGNVCFTDGTMLEAPNGPKAIEDLLPGDELTTLDNGPREILWIWRRKIGPAELRANPLLNAVSITAGALGSGSPSRTLKVSRQHRILVSSKIANRMFGKPEVLVPAKDLLGLPGVESCAPEKPLTYFHILMRDHEILLADGMAAESLYLGADARKTLEPAAAAELKRILGPGWEQLVRTPPRPARMLASGKRVRNMVWRHLRNRKSVQTAASAIPVA